MKFGILLAVMLAAWGGLTAKGEDKKNPVVVMETSEGVIEIELFADKAPKTVENFMGYVKDKFYDGVIFHRVIPNFMVQGGGFTPDMNQKKTKGNIQNEAANGLKNETGTLAMARTPDPHSASSQFFINVKDNDFLNYRSSDAAGFGYCVFGKVVAGMDIVKKIEGVATGNKGMHQNVPTTPVIIKSVTEKADKK